MDAEKLAKSTTTDGKPPAPGLENAGAPQPLGPDGQHRAYWVLSEEERKKGFVRPVRDAYVHEKCGATTTMGRALAETYAANPVYYGSTFCCRCKAHFPVSEFHWEIDGVLQKTRETVGS